MRITMNMAEAVTTCARLNGVELTCCVAADDADGRDFPAQGWALCHLLELAPDTPAIIFDGIRADTGEAIAVPMPIRPLRDTAWLPSLVLNANGEAIPVLLTGQIDFVQEP